MPVHVYPSPQQARELLERGEVVVLSSAFIADGLTPTAALARLGPQPLGRFLLESAEQGERVGRYSFVGAGVRELVAFDGIHGFAFGWEPAGGGQVVEQARWPQRDILAELRARLSDLRCPAQPDLPPFFGGAVGFLGYDVVRTIEHLPDGRPDPVGSWTAGFLVADVVVAFDHFRRLAYLLALCRRQEGETARQAYERAAGRLEEVRWRLARSPAGELEPPLLEAPQWATPVPAPPEDIVRRHLPRKRGQPPGIPGGYIVTIPLGQRTAGLLVALERPDAEPAGLTAVQALMVGGHFWHGRMEVVLYIDERASPAQREALTAIFSGAAGGPYKFPGRLIQRVQRVEYAPMRFTIEPRRRRFWIPGVMDFTIEALDCANPGGGFTEIRGSMHFVDPVYVAKAVASWFRGAGYAWDHTGRSGFFGVFDLQGP